MRLTFLLLLGLLVLSLLLPLPRQYLENGSAIYNALEALWIPESVLHFMLHPACVTPLAHLITLRVLHLLLSIPIRMFLSGFGLDVRSFRGTSITGMILSFRLKNKMELVLRIDEIGLDVRTMRRLRIRLRMRWTQLKRYFQSHHSGLPPTSDSGAEGHGASAAPQTSRDSLDSAPPTESHSSGANMHSSSTPPHCGSGSSGVLAKRLQLYARGVHLQLFVMPGHKTKSNDDSAEDSMWFGLGDRDDDGGVSVSEDAPQDAANSTTNASADEQHGKHFLDSKARQSAANLAKRISNTLRTYTYFASLFSRWVDISVTDLSLNVVRSNEMARAGHGVTLHISNVLLWAESARDSSHQGSASGGQRSAWTQIDILSSLRGIFGWVLRVTKIWRARPLDDQTLDPAVPETAAQNMSSNIISRKRLRERLRRLSSRSGGMRDRSQKYLSTLALEVNGIRVFPGIDGAQRHMNSRWELVKMLVMQEMLPSKSSFADGDKPHHRGPVLDCQRCTIRNEVITSFWGLPKKIDQSIEFGQTHMRAGILESLLDEVAVMCVAPSVRIPGFSLRGLRALNSQLATILQQYDRDSSSSSGESADTSSKAQSTAENSADQADQSSADAEYARDQVGRILFQLHEVLSKLRMEHVGIALRVTEFVFDLPLSPDKNDFIIRTPAMLRWRQRGIEVEYGYMWSSVGSGLESRISSAKLQTDDQNHVVDRNSADINPNGSDNEDNSKDEPADYAWSETTREMFGHSFEGEYARRSKDSTAFIRISAGQVQMIALKTPSMTPDIRAEELVPKSSGFKLRYCTLYGEMSAFLSEDLSQRPCPQPIFSLEVGRPELRLDLQTQLAIDEAKLWAKGIGHRFGMLRRVLQFNSPKDSQKKVDVPRKGLSHNARAIISLVFADVKAHVIIERAMYVVQPEVPLQRSARSGKDSSGSQKKHVVTRVRHVECHFSWNLFDNHNDIAESDSDDGSGSESSSSGKSPLYRTPNMNGPDKEPMPDGLGDDDVLVPRVKFRLTTSPISTRWENATEATVYRKKDTISGTLLHIKHGVRSHGTARLCIGQTAEAMSMPRANVDINTEVSEVTVMARDYDFRNWLSMQPLWLAAELMRVLDNDHKKKESSPLLQSPAPTAPTPSNGVSHKSESFYLPPVQERRKDLTATMCTVFESVRLTIMACDNDEDVQSGIEHGTQICFSRGNAALRVNGGSLESPHSFGFRSDAGRTTLNIECQRASMFLLSAVSKASARSDVLQQSNSLYSDFSAEDLCGYIPDTVNEHIVLLRPQFNYSRRKVEPFRSSLIFDLNTSSFSGTTGVSSVYRWSVFMHHVKYWLRRKKLARRMATQHVAPSPPDDILVSINSDLLDLQGDLVLPLFFDLDVGLAKSFEAEHNKGALGKQSPQMRLKMPHVRFKIEKTKDSTDNDLTIAIRSPIATFYGSSTPRGQRTRCSMQPLMSLKECNMSFKFPNKKKRAELGAKDGVRRNSTYSHIDIAFERAAMAIGHRYNMAETIDGYLLLQKGCKRIARKSTSSCFPPLPFPEEALDRPCTAKMVLSALGNPRTMMPPPLRSLSNTFPTMSPELAEPDDIPSIDFHGPEFSIMIHDDPFETALSRIYQVGLHEQRERLSRLESFNTKAEALRAKREQEFMLRRAAMKKSSRGLREASETAKSSKDLYGHRRHKRTSGRPPKSRRAMKESNTFSSTDRVGSRTWVNMRSAMTHSATFTSTSTSDPHRDGTRYSHSRTSNALPQQVGMNGVASMSMQDVTMAVSAGGEIKSRHRTNSAAAETTHGSLVSLSSEGQASVNAGEDGLGHVNETDDNDEEHNYEDVVGDSNGPESHQQVLDLVNAEIDAAYQRLMLVEAREWVKAIRKKMMPPQAADDEEAQINNGMDFGEIFDMPSATSNSHAEQRCGSPNALPPYSYAASSWTHPSVPLGHLFMSPIWVSLDTPLSLLEFDQIERYLRYLDPTTPHNPKWSTLVPTRLRIKCGGVKMQLRDFPFPLFKVPDPYRSETDDTTLQSVKSYDSLYGGIEVSGSFVIAERIADENSLRSVCIPVGPRSKDSDINLARVGWYFSKSLQFPRIFSSLSSRLPPLPIMSTWGVSYQPVISAFMQRLESITSKSADVSPSLPWWDKQRLRNHIRVRMAVIDAPQISEQPLNKAHLNADDLGIRIPGNQSPSEKQGQGENKESSNSCQDVDSTGEKGQMFFLALDGRDPYQVTQKPGSYLFTMRGGVRVCINEGIPGSELWDTASGRGIYSVPTEEAVPPSATLGEFLRLRCKEFLMGVPIIVDRQSMLLKSIDPLFGIGGEVAEESTPDIDDFNGDNTLSHTDTLSWKKAYSDLLRSISRANSARYTFVTQSVHQLYHKGMLHLSGGVRLGIGISSYIPPDSSGLRHNHWEVQPIAPERAVALAARGIRDAYVGCRSSKLHTSVSLLCPFTEKESQKTSRPFVDMYLDHGDGICLDAGDNNSGILCLRRPNKSILEKEPKQWNVYDTDALVSPMHSLLPRDIDNAGVPSGSSKDLSNAQDMFFTPFSCHDFSGEPGQDSPHAAFTARRDSEGPKERAIAKPQCQIHASAATVEGVTNFLPLFVARMMLPVRKGTLYPFTETSGNKLGMCLRSIRLVLDLKNVELAYSQRDFEVKEMETKEMAILGYGDTAKNNGLSPTPSEGPGDSAGQGRLGAKAEGTMRELKARVESFSFNLLLEQTSVKLQVGTASASPSSAPNVEEVLGDISEIGVDVVDGKSADNSSANSFSRNSRAASFSTDQAWLDRSKQKTGSSSSHISTMPRVESTSRLARKKTTETNVLRWSVGDASLEIDYLDVRLTQMSFIMPVFFNPMAEDIFKTCTQYNGLWFDGDSLSALPEFERSWISNTSIRDLKELDISESIFSNPSIVCVLWSPRMVYFTQRPEWTHFDNALDDILDFNAAPASMSSPRSDAGPEPSLSKVPSTGADLQSIAHHLSHQPESLFGPGGLASLTSTVAGAYRDENTAEDHSLLQRSLSAHRARALSDLRQASHPSRPYTSSNAPPSMSVGGEASVATPHRRNTSMPWVTGNSDVASSLQSGDASEVPIPLSLALHPATTQSHFGFLGSIFPTVQPVHKPSTPPPQLASASGTPSSSPYPLDIQTRNGGDLTADSKSPQSAMQYKSSFHLLELARSRQRRLTTSNSRHSIKDVHPSSQSTRDMEPGSAMTVELQRLPSIHAEQTLTTNNQMSRMMPTGPDPKVIMRDSRSTQAMLLCKRKEMLGTAIRQEQAELDVLSHEFELAPSRHNESYRREMVRKAEHIYELVARRKLINRCLRFLGVDLNVSASAQPGGSLYFNEDDEGELADPDTQHVEKILASLYRHRCLIYSGYLIWTAQVRDKLMRFLYIQDCLTAISYYMSETATKVVRKGASSREQDDFDCESSIPAASGQNARRTPSSSAAGKGQRRHTRRRQSPTEATPGEKQQQQQNQYLAPNSGEDWAQSRKRSMSTGQESTTSASSGRTLQLPGLLRRLRSNDRLSERSSKGSSKGSAWKSMMSGFGKQKTEDSQSHHKHKHEHKHQHEHKQRPKDAKKKPKERVKEGHKSSKARLVNNKFERGLKNVWDDFMHYRPYYSILVEFLNSQVSMRVDENESATSAIAVAERVQLHRILLCNESDVVDNFVSDGSNSLHVTPPDDESIVKTRNLIELENVQVFTAKREDFRNLPAYFVDCMYGSRTESGSSKLSNIWPAWIPIELLLSQSKQKIRGIFDDLEEESKRFNQNRDDGSNSSDSDGDCKEDGFSNGEEGETADNHRSQRLAGHTRPAENARRKNSQRGKAWWLEDLSKYKRLMDRNNGLVVYDKANPHRIQGDTSERTSVAAAAKENDVNNDNDDAHTSANGARRAGTDGASAEENVASPRSGKFGALDPNNHARKHGHSVSNNGLGGYDSDDASAPLPAASIDEDKAVRSSGSQGLSHRANHFSVFLPELNLACTAEQYISLYEIVTDLLVFSDPEKAAYMDDLNTILLGMDMSNLNGLLSIIQATQEALRERMPLIHDWYTVQHGNVILFRESRRLMSSSANVAMDRGFNLARLRSQASSLYTLDWHRRVLEQQLRTTMDVFGAAQKQMKQQRKLEKLSGAKNGVMQPRKRPTRSTSAAAASQIDGDGDGASVFSRSSRRNGAGAGAAAGSGSKESTPAAPFTTTGRGKEKQPAYDMPSLLSSSSSASSFLSFRSSGERENSESHGAIARTIHLFISKATWHMLENDEQPLCDMTLRWASLKAVTTSDQATHLLSEVHLLYIVNRLPNPMFTDLVGPYIQPKQPKPDFCVEKMIRVRWSELAPVGGISIVERFEVDLYPTRLQLSHDIAQKLINYLYPPQESSTSTNANANANASANAGNAGESTGQGAAAMLHSGDAPRSAYMGSAAAGGSEGEYGAALSPTSSGVRDSMSPTNNTGAGAGGAKSLFTSRLRKNLDSQSRATSVSSTRSTPGPGLGLGLGSGMSASATPEPDYEDRSGQPALLKSPLQGGAAALSSFSGRSTPLSLFSESNAMSSMSRGSENRSQVDQMKKRASSNKTFLNIKIGGSTLCISYQGRRANNITDLRDFEFHAPTLELRNQVESYYELLMQVKKEYMSVAVHHTGALVKEKFRQLHNRKAWSKTSFGPDWEARKLLIDMDRRIEEDLVVSLADGGDGSGGIMVSDQESSSLATNPGPVPVDSPDHANSAAQASIVEQEDGDASVLDGSRSRSSSQASSVSRFVRRQQQQQQQISYGPYLGDHSTPSINSSNTAAGRHQTTTYAGDADDAISISSTKSKAPQSKYMILDPRKLMGMRLPNVLPRNSSSSAEASNISVPLLWRQRPGDTQEQQQQQRSASERPGGHEGAQTQHGLAAMHHPGGPPSFPRRFTSTAPSFSSSSSSSGMPTAAGERDGALGVPPIVVRRATDVTMGDSSDGNGSGARPSQSKDKAVR
ncbi:Protein SABRE [Coemansia sp. RSA 1939]|nr:Protein SABRE [Coemansia sp. RSA 1939]